MTGLDCTPEPPSLSLGHSGNEHSCSGNQPEPSLLCQVALGSQSDNSLWKLRLEGGFLRVPLKCLFIYLNRLFIEEAVEELWECLKPGGFHSDFTFLGFVTLGKSPFLICFLGNWKTIPHVSSIRLHSSTEEKMRMCLEYRAL